MLTLRKKDIFKKSETVSQTQKCAKVKTDTLEIVISVVWKQNVTFRIVNNNCFS